MKISLCQVNSRIADLEYNFQKIKKYYEQEIHNVDLVVCPELFLTGYLLKDLVKNLDLLSQVNFYISKISEITKNSETASLVGYPILLDDKILNIASIFRNDKIIFTAQKKSLPNYNIFNESRNFSEAQIEPNTFNFKGEKIGVIICEDAWHDYVPNILAEKGATIFLIINASPFDLKKQQRRVNISKIWLKNIVLQYCI